MPERFYLIGILFVNLLLMNTGIAQRQPNRKALADALRHGKKFAERIKDKDMTVFLSWPLSDKSRVIDLMFEIEGRTPDPLYPHLITLDRDEENETNIFDYPEFKGSRLGFTDQLIVYHQMMMQAAKRVRIMLTMRFYSDVGDFEEALIQLARSCSALFPKARDFGRSVGLMTTLIPANVRYPNQKVFPDSEDATYFINLVGNRISRLYYQLEKGNWTLHFRSHKEFTNSMAVLKSLLEVEDELYSKIYASPSNYERQREIVKYFLRSFVNGIPFTRADNFKNRLSSKIIKSLAEDMNESVRMSFAAIAQQLIGKFTMASDNSLDIVRDSRNFKNTRNTFLKIKNNAFTLEKFVKNFIITLKNLGINISSRKLQPSLEERDIFPILGELVGAQVEKPLYWFGGLDKFITHLENFEKWATFLNILFTELPRSVFFNNNLVHVKNVLGKLYKLLNEENAMKVSDIGLASFFTNINELGNEVLLSPYRRLANMVVGKTHLWPLVRTFEQFEKKPTVKCPTGKNSIEIIGVFVKASDINTTLQNPCVSPAQVIEVMAFNSIIFDTGYISLYGNETTLAIIAPEWISPKKYNIYLNGKNGEEAVKRNDTKISGSDGEAGKPGGPGGNFFGIAGRMSDASYVSVMANGGNGGSGQDGTDGANGEGGRFVGKNETEGKFDMSKFQDFAYYWDEENNTRTYYFPDDDKKTYYECNHIWKVYNKTKYYEVNDPEEHPDLPNELFTWMVNGTKGLNGSKGGDGGQGGEGGVPGTVKFIELSKGRQLNWVSLKNGTSGKDGNGGKGGKGGESGKVILIKCGKPFKYKCERLSEEYTNFAPDGEDGATNSTKGKQAKKSPPDYKPYTSINRFKSAAREHLKESINKIEVREFINRIERNSNVTALYDHISFIDELKSIEEQFYELYKTIDFLPFYESLLHRIDKFAERSKKDRDIQLAILSVYTATFSKLSMLRYNVYGFMIVDVRHSLSKIVQEISVIEKLGKELMVSNYAKEYTEEVDEEVKSSEQILQQQLIPEINNLFKKVQEEMKSAISDVEQVQKGAKFQKQETERQKEIQKQAFIKKIVMGAISAVGAIAGALFPGVGTAIAIGTAVLSTAVGALYNTGEQHLSQIKEERQAFFRKLPPGRNFDVTGMGKISTKFKEVLLNQVKTIIDDAIQMNGPDKVNQFKQIIKDRLTQLRKNIEQKAKATVRQINEFREKVIYHVKDTYNKFKDDLKGFKNPLETVKRFQKAAIGLLSDAATMYSDISDYRQNKAALEAEGEALDGELQGLNQYKNNLVSVSASVVDDVGNGVTATLNNLSGKKSVEITASKWDLSKKMADVKLQFNAMLQGIPAGDNIQNIFKKVERLIDTIMVMYEKIQKCNDQKKFAELQANLASSRNLWDVGDKALFGKLNELSFAIRTSNVLVQYDRALHALKQYVFPFAHHFLQEFSTPPSLKMSDDFKDILYAIIPQVQKLYSSLDDWIRNINHHDTVIYQDVYFTENYNQPFYIATYSENKEMIQSLLKGDPILINADLENGIDKDAVKFNVMEIKLNLFDKSKEKVFTEALAHFDMEMTHQGFNMYRCGSKKYEIKSEKQIIRHSFRMNEDGLPVRVNVVYDKMSKGGYYLSPYGLWSLRLRQKKGRFDLLQQFLEEPINILFEGRGQYVNDSQILRTACQTQMDNYYTQSNGYAHLDELLAKVMSLNDLEPV